MVHRCVGSRKPREFPFILLTYVGSFVLRGWMALADNEHWIVLVQKQRRPWRGFDTLHSVRFTKPTDAAAYMDTIRRRIAAGEPLPVAQD